MISARRRPDRLELAERRASLDDCDYGHSIKLRWMQLQEPVEREQLISVRSFHVLDDESS
jgi:hypothetical protein